MQSDTSSLADVFEKFRNKYIEIYKFGPSLLSISTAISISSVFKKSEVELGLLTNIDMLQMVEKGIRGGICHARYPYAKTL